MNLNQQPLAAKVVSMRIIIAALALLGLSLPAFADVYSIAATMPATSGSSTCKLYVNGTAQAAKTCASNPITFPALIPAEGSYTFAYSGVSAAGTEGAKSPTVTVTIDKTPGTPASPPGISVKCRDASGADVTCPPTIIVTQSP